VLTLLNLVAGIWVVILVALLAQQLWGEKAARLTASIAAFYPFAAFNSAIPLREEFSILFFVFGLYFFTKWARAGGGAGILLALAGFACASMIHPGWSAAFLGVGAYAASILVQIFAQGLKTKTIKRRNIRAAGNSLAVLAVAIISIVITGGVQLGKGIGVLTEEFDLVSTIEGRFGSDPSGGSAYPALIATGDPYAQPWLIPSRMIYFVFSPFPWDIRSPVHLLGLVSSLLYLVLCWRIYRAFPRLRERPECVAMLFMLFALVFVFAVGTTNIGTAIRHRTKLLVLFLLLAGPEFARGAFLPRIRLRSARTRVLAIH
jgi:4-amino-4-deoxy-L-arabinose transferase-like glycosyltransferase